MTTNYMYTDVDIEFVKQTNGDVTKDTGIDAVKNSIKKRLHPKSKLEPVAKLKIIFFMLSVLTVTWIGENVNMKMF